jgi:hypothetical protein
MPLTAFASLIEPRRDSRPRLSKRGEAPAPLLSARMDKRKPRRAALAWTAGAGRLSLRGISLHSFQSLS